MNSNKKFIKHGGGTDLAEYLRGGLGLCVEEVQNVARVLDAVLGRLLRGREAVVPGAVEVLEAAAAVLQLVALARHDGLLLGHAEHTHTQIVLDRTFKTVPLFCHQVMVGLDYPLETSQADECQLRHRKSRSVYQPAQ